MIKQAAYIVTLLCLLTAQPVVAALISNNDVHEAEQKAQARQMEYKKLQAQAVQLNVELADVNKKMIKAAKQLQDEEEKTTKTEAELKLLENKLRVAQENFDKEYGNLAQTLSALQNLALHPTESLLMQPLSPVNVIRSAVLMRESVPFLNDKAEQIRTDLQNISKQKKQHELKLAELEKHKKSIQEQQKSLKQLSAKKVAMRKKIEGESRKTQAEATKLAQQASDLRDLMEKLEHDKELKRRRQEEIKRAAREREELRRLEEEQKRRMSTGKSSGLQTETGEIYGDSESDLINIKAQSINNGEINFAGVRGKLTKPARGQVVTSYGQELSKGVTSKGMVIKTRPSAQVIAPYDGSVIFAGPFKGYGNLIIIEHGENYMSLLAGLNAVEAQMGQMVLAGEPIGVMPDTDMAKLYIEIRKNRKPVNPAPWFAM